VMVVADPTLASIQMWWWDSLGAAVFAFLGFPAAGCDAGVVFGIGQGEVVDIGLAAAGPVADRVMDLAVPGMDVQVGYGSGPVIAGCIRSDRSRRTSS
jgi:hypothetical protein